MAHRSLELDPHALARLDRIGDEFLADFLALAVSQDPQRLEALAELAHVLTRLGRPREGLRADLALCRACPEDPTVLYNLACSLCLVGRHQAALRALAGAIRRGYDDLEHLLEDRDLEALRSLPGFQELIKALEAP